MKHSKHIPVVVMGGGTGIFPVVSTLNTLDAAVTAIVAASDSGGSTGKIRDEFGFPPVGDLRQSLAALASNESLLPIRQLLLYRFDKGEGLKGHNLGNLILTALQDLTGSTTQALDLACKIFRLEGRVVPVTESSVHLKIVYADGTSEIGEHILDAHQPKAKKIDHVVLTPACSLNPIARDSLQAAHHILIGPGDLYASLLAVLVTPGLKQVLEESKTPITYISNLMTRSAQTNNMTAKDHLAQIELHIGRPVDHVIINSATIDPSIVAAYAAEDEHPVVDDFDQDARVIRADLLNDAPVERNQADAVRRSLLRHNQNKLQQVLESLV